MSLRRNSSKNTSVFHKSVFLQTRQIVMRQQLPICGGSTENDGTQLLKCKESLGYGKARFSG